MTLALEELPGKGLLPVLCRMLCLALMKARMSESVWLSPVRGTDDTGLSGMLGTMTHHTLPCLTFGPGIHLSRALFLAHSWICSHPRFSAACAASHLHPREARGAWSFGSNPAWLLISLGMKFGPFLCDLGCSLHSSHPVSLIDQAPPGLWPFALPSPPSGLLRPQTFTRLHKLSSPPPSPHPHLSAQPLTDTNQAHSRVGLPSSAPGLGVVSSRT